jgi:hypothetical protein
MFLLPFNFSQYLLLETDFQTKRFGVYPAVLIDAFF